MDVREFAGPSADGALEHPADWKSATDGPLDAPETPDADALPERTDSARTVQKDADTPDKPDNYPHFDAGIGFDASVADSPIGVWTHLAVTHDGATARLYMNGSLVTSRSFVAAFRPDTAKVVICGNQNDASGAIQERWNGLVDDVRLYNRALSSTEIAGLTQ